MKLLQLLFENTVGFLDFIRELEQARNSSGPELFTLIDDPTTFYETNKQEIDNILKGATEFKFLGSGAYGSAFSLGDKVLKLEPSPYRQKIVMSRFKKETKKGKYLPMIYAHGTLKTDVPEEDLEYPNESTIYYTILEKFDTENIQKYENLLFKIKRETERYTEPQLSNQQLLNLIKKNYGPKLAEMQADLRLSNNWLPQLLKDMKNLRNLSIQDFHAGNIGIRRVGGEGYFVFFD